MFNMFTYAIGDVQGCWATLQALLATVAFDRTRDRLWLVGDLVNRGPDSLAVLRFLRELGDRATVVLGNHDLHLLARHAGVAGPKERDTLDEVLAAPDAAALMTWLRSRPLFHREGRWAMVHAGIPPGWTLERTAAEARALETRLRSSDPAETLLRRDQWPAALRALVTMRTCHQDGTLCAFSGAPEDAPPGCLPWFSHPRQLAHDATVIFGHWAAMGRRLVPGFAGLDSGCVWGGELTALRLEDGQVFTEPARDGGEREAGD